jgi:hypothetical protein
VQVQMIVLRGRECFVRLKRNPKKIGWLPNYLLEPIDIPGETLAEQIQLVAFVARVNRVNG